MKYYIPLMIGILSTNLLAQEIDRKPFIPIDHSQISADSLFLDSKILKVPLKRGTLRDGDNYTYQKQLNSNTYALFRIRLEGLFHQYQDRVEPQEGILAQRLRFTEKDNINIGIDIGFEVGKVLSSDTFITEIIQYNDSAPYFDGKLAEDWVDIDTYNIKYQLKSSGREYKLSSGHVFHGNFDTAKYYTGFVSGFNEKINDLKISVIEKSTRIRRTGPRPNDTVMPERYKKMTKEARAALFKQYKSEAVKREGERKEAQKKALKETPAADTWEYMLKLQKKKPRIAVCYGSSKFSENYDSCLRDLKNCHLVEGKERVRIIKNSQQSIPDLKKLITTHCLKLQRSGDTTTECSHQSITDLKKMINISCLRLQALDVNATECDEAIEDYKKYYPDT